MRHLSARFAANIALVVALGLGAGLSRGETIRLSQPVVEDARSETFGAPMPEAQADVPALPLKEVVTRAEELLGRELLVTARVAQVCQMKGCFFVAQDGATALRVSFRDYAFFVPTDIAGRTVTLVGELVRKHRDEAEAAHLQDDAGAASASLRAGDVYEIVASAVRVPRSQPATSAFRSSGQSSTRLAAAAASPR